MPKRPLHPRIITYQERFGDELVTVKMRELPSPPIPDSIRQPPCAAGFTGVDEYRAECADCGRHTRHVHVEYDLECSSKEEPHVIGVCTRCAAVDASALPHACEFIEFVRWYVHYAVANRRLEPVPAQPHCRR